MFNGKTHYFDAIQWLFWHKLEGNPPDFLPSPRRKLILQSPCFEFPGHFAPAAVTIPFPQRCDAGHRAMGRQRIWAGPKKSHVRSIWWFLISGFGSILLTQLNGSILHYYVLWNSVESGSIPQCQPWCFLINLGLGWSRKREISTSAWARDS